MFNQQIKLSSTSCKGYKPQTSMCRLWCCNATTMLHPCHPRLAWTCFFLFQGRTQEVPAPDQEDQPREDMLPSEYHTHQLPSVVLTIAQWLNKWFKFLSSNVWIQPSHMTLQQMPNTTAQPQLPSHNCPITTAQPRMPSKSCQAPSAQPLLPLQSCPCTSSHNYPTTVAQPQLYKRNCVYTIIAQPYALAPTTQPQQPIHLYPAPTA